ncbi:transposable element p transposase [Plakobranchus ocellatus]|uniref:Transposable element p transposase n=1 Tax=Plakobranchus ocellatus TaxID=259542 RepID=A0AAV4AIA5_9GAST|nr:transposable element p transposase [Plakobranchus ocellatus]
MRGINIYPGLNQGLLKALGQKINSLPSGSEVCSLVFDEISLKEGVTYNVERDEIEGLEDFGVLGKPKLLANHANVFMVRGLKVNWKQPVGYVLSSGPIDSIVLKQLLFDCLDKLHEIGLNVKCVIADQGSNNQKLFSKLLHIDKDRPYFMYNSRKYFVLYDPPHLIKNIRNNLQSSGFTVDGNNILWQNIVDFYELDIQSNLRLAPKLTKNHIYLPPFSKLRVKYATQVLYHSVAAGLSFVGTLKNDPNLIATANFIDRFDKLFNVFNSGTCHFKQPMAHAFSNNSGHVSFLNETMEWGEGTGESEPAVRSAGFFLRGFSSYHKRPGVTEGLKA